MKLTKSKLREIIKEVITENKYTIIEGKHDWMANYGNVSITFKNGYKYSSADELDKMFYTVGDIVKKNKFPVKSILFVMGK